MLLPGENNPKTWLFFTILVSTIIAISETKGGETLNIRLGFDLTQGSNGAPSLRIRDFQDSAEYNPRAVDDASSSNDSGSKSNTKKKTSPRAESSESEEREHPKKEESSKEPAKPVAKSSSGSDDDDEKTSVSHEDKLRSTRGLKAGDFEPEEEKNPKIHARYKKNSESDAISDESAGRRRYKRDIGRFGHKKG